MSLKHSRSNGAALDRKFPKDKNGRVWPKATLEELRWRKELALYDGDVKLAFVLACEIDKARGLY